MHQRQGIQILFIFTHDYRNSSGHTQFIILMTSETDSAFSCSICSNEFCLQFKMPYGLEMWLTVFWTDRNFCFILLLLKKCHCKNSVSSFCLLVLLQNNSLCSDSVFSWKSLNKTLNHKPSYNLAS